MNIECRFQIPYFSRINPDTKFQIIKRVNKEAQCKFIKPEVMLGRPSFPYVTGKANFRRIDNAGTLIREFQFATDIGDISFTKERKNLSEAVDFYKITWGMVIKNDKWIIQKIAEMVQTARIIKYTLTSALLINLIDSKKPDTEKALKAMKSARYWHAHDTILSVLEMTENLWKLRNLCLKGEDCHSSIETLVAKNPKYLLLFPFVFYNWGDLEFPYQTLINLILLPVNSKNDRRLKGEMLVRLAAVYPPLSLIKLCESNALSLKCFTKHVDLKASSNEKRLVDLFVVQLIATSDKMLKLDFIEALKFYLSEGADSSFICDHILYERNDKSEERRKEQIQCLTESGYLLTPHLITALSLCKPSMDFPIISGLDSIFILHDLGQITPYEIPKLEKVLALIKMSSLSRFLKDFLSAGKAQMRLQGIIDHLRKCKAQKKIKKD